MTGPIIKSETIKNSLKKIKPRHLMRALAIFLGAIILTIVLAIISLSFYLTKERVESLAKDKFNANTSGILELTVESFSLFKGFKIKNLAIKEDKGPENSPLLLISEINLNYNLLSFLKRDIHIKNLEIINPSIYLKQNKLGWNFETLFQKKKSQVDIPPETMPLQKSKKPEKKAPSAAKSPKQTETILPLTIDLLVNLKIKDLALYVIQPESKTSIQGIDLDFNAHAPSLKKIPTGIEALKIFEKLHIGLNTERPLKVAHSSSSLSTNPDLIFSWIVDLNKKPGPSIQSSLEIGSKNTPIKFKGTKLMPLNFMLGYNLRYFPSKDLLSLKHLSLSFKKRNLINITGQIESLMKNPLIHISMKESDINLKEIMPYYRALSGDRETVASGSISLMPAEINGTPDNISAKGSVCLRNLILSKGTEAVNIPKGDIDYLLTKNSGGLKADLSSSIPSFKYKLNGEASSRQYLDLIIKARTNPDLTTFNIPEFNLELKDRRKTKALSLNAELEARNEVSRTLALKINNFMVLMPALKQIMPASISRQIAGLPVKEKIKLMGIVQANDSKDKQHLSVSLKSAVPEYKINNLSIDADLSQLEWGKKLILKKLSLQSPALHLGASVRGWLRLDSEPFSFADLAVNLRYKDHTPRTLPGNWSIQGESGIDLNFKGSPSDAHVKGKLFFDNFTVSNNPKRLTISDLDMDFPFDTVIQKGGEQGRSILQLSKESLIDNEFFKNKPNLKIAFLKAKHPVRKTEFEYISDLSANIAFTKGIFSINDLRMKLMDGSIYGRTLMIKLPMIDPENPGSISMEDFEYRLALDAAGINAGLLDEPDRRKTDKNASLSFNALLSGKGLNPGGDFRANGYVNIYEIGDKFANRLLRGLSTEKGKSKLGLAQPVVDNFTVPREFNFTLDKGSVYTRVKFKGKIISKAINIENGQITYDRIPLQDYLRKVREEER